MEIAAKNSGTISTELRTLYKKYGYTRFKMSKFEEYDTYVQIKDFLISDQVITFTDTNGKLLAMKPDVTVSIIKNSEKLENQVQKVYYNENVYRVSAGAHGFREIMQTGLECIGQIDPYNICEVILLAAMSLSQISRRFVLDVSHMGFVSGLISSVGFTSEETAKVLKAVSEKNVPALSAICEQKQLPKETAEKIVALPTIYGPIQEVVKQLDSFCENQEMRDAVLTLSQIGDALQRCGLAQNVQLDFSVVNDMNYYNGIVFRGYIEGVPEGVLSGGQYDKLMEKMGKQARAIGFAVYLDQLERLFGGTSSFDTDVLLCYDDSCTPASVLKAAQDIINEGKTVLVQKTDSGNIRYQSKRTLTKGGTELENG